MLNEYLSYSQIKRIKPALALTNNKGYPIETMEQVKKRMGCDMILSGGAFNLKTYELSSGLKIDGRVVKDNQTHGLGSNDEKHLEWSYAGIWHKDWIGAFYDTINNGVHSNKLNDKAKRGRLGVGAGTDGVQFVAIGESEKAYRCTSTTFMLTYFKGCKHAINEDGGFTVQYDTPFGKYTSTRRAPWYICIWLVNPLISFQVFNVRTYLAVRDKPSLVYKELGRLHTGDVVQVRAWSGNYAEIDYHGRNAYVTGKYIRRVL